MGLAMSNGWTVFGLVTQDYTLPAAALKVAGWDELELDPLQVDALEVEPLAISPLEAEPWTVNEIELSVLRRGVIRFGHVAYV